EKFSSTSHRLVEWLANIDEGTGLQLQIRATPEAHNIQVSLVLDVDGDEPGALASLVRSRTQDISRVLRGCDGARFASLTSSDEVAWRLKGPWQNGRIAVPVPWRIAVHPELPIVGCAPWSPLGASALAEVVRLLLLEDGPTVLTVSLTPIRPRLLANALLSAVSIAVSRVAGSLDGVSFRSEKDTTLSHFYPEQLLGLQKTQQTLDNYATWLEALGDKALACRIAVVGRHDPSTPLLGAVQHACIGVRGVKWCAASDEQALQLASGPLAAMRCPTGVGEADALSDHGPVAELVTGWIPVPVAVEAIALPLPDFDGLPGLPKEPAPPRLFPEAFRRQNCGAILGLGSGPLGRRLVRIGDADLARHVYTCGKTGVGKSTILATLAIDLALDGGGVGVIDPHGDLADRIIDGIGWERKVVVFDPTKSDVSGLDPLWNDGSTDSIERVVEDLTAIMFRLYDVETMGPMFERMSRAMLL
ncbi:MAG: DUF87 domain-containing protein, partial [Proteobacteria bacterium]|nr:DUF87 domain-containing protein [Pseudomonadota bacterium]